MVPDGVLPAWLWIAGWILAALAIAAALRSATAQEGARLIPLAGTMAAVMTIVMSLEIVPLGYEPHLTVLSGILLGPSYGLLATFVFNLLRLMVGDGSVTLLGLNTLLLGLETVAGALIFRGLTRVWPNAGQVGPSAAVATFVALALSTIAFLGLIAFAAVDPRAIAEEGLLARAGTDEPGFALYARLVLALGAIGWTLEAVAVGAMTAFISAVRPSLI